MSAPQTEPNRDPRILIDPEDEHLLAGRPVVIAANGYARVKGRTGGARDVHVVVMGGTRRGLHIDHINGDRLDCRKANLRFVTCSANQVNRKRLNKNNRSGVRGVHRSPCVKSKPWVARITVQGRQIALGYFESVAAAQEARLAAEINYFGEPCPTAAADPFQGAQS